MKMIVVPRQVYVCIVRQPREHHLRTLRSHVWYFDRILSHQSLSNGSMYWTKAGIVPFSDAGSTMLEATQVSINIIMINSTLWSSDVIHHTTLAYCITPAATANDWFHETFYSNNSDEDVVGWANVSNAWLMVADDLDRFCAVFSRT